MMRLAVEATAAEREAAYNALRTKSVEDINAR